MSKILNQLPHLESGMKDVNRPVFNNPENKKRNRDLDVAILMLFKNMLILKEFIINPVQSCGEITRIHADLPYSKDFVELTKAINCSHTKEQGTSIGIKKLVEAIGKVKEECKEKCTSVNSKIGESVNEIDTIKELSTSSFDGETLGRRLAQATENDYFTNHTVNNVDKILVPAAITMGPTVSVNKFLKAIKDVYLNNDKGFNTLINSISDLVKDTDGKLAYIEANNKYMFTTQFNKTKFEFSDFSNELKELGNPKKDLFFNKLIKTTAESIPQEEGTTDKLSLIKEMIDGTSVKVASLNENLDKLKELYNALLQVADKIPLVVTLDSIYNDLVVPMGSMTISLDEYSAKLDNYKIVIQNLCTLRDRIETFVELVKPSVTNLYNVDDKIYKYIDKILVKSTMYKGQEKEPQVLITDASPVQGAGK